MNDRILELISAYLHRGSTPEQERELFEACSRNPETAELLRQHLILSLKLHTLRDEVQVPAELHNNVLGRINALEAEGIEREAAQPRIVPEQSRRRFGWAHLLGTGIAGAACTLALLLWTGGPADETVLQPMAGVQDTVFIAKTDTLTQLRSVDRPVYIVRSVPSPSPETPRAAEAPDMAMQSETGTATQSGIAGVEVRKDESRADTDRAPLESMPLLADLRESEAATREVKTQNFLEQYNSMLVSMESVQLSAKDRLH